MIVIARGDDWEGLYINGLLAVEDHSLSAEDVLMALEKDYHITEVDLQWLHTNGHLPRELMDVKTIDD